MVETKNVTRVSMRYHDTQITKASICSSNNAADFIRKHLYGDDIHLYESMFILLLDVGNNVISYAKISQGTINGTISDVKIVMRYALENLSFGIILCHNHPSGQLKASQSDINTHNKFKKAFNIFDISYIDN